MRKKMLIIYVHIEAKYSNPAWFLDIEDPVSMLKIRLASGFENFDFGLKNPAPR
jgi:hypothetical protein